MPHTRTRHQRNSTTCQTRPLVNASLPPEHWQTYDITFRAPRMNSDGSVKERVFSFHFAPDPYRACLSSGDRSKSNGKVDTKESYLSAIKSGATRYQSMTRDDIKVSVYGHSAVVTCHWEVHVLARGNKMDMNARYLHVYVEQSNGWKLVAHESTRIAP